MDGLNRITLVGNVGSITAPEGKAFAAFSLATTRSWRDENGEQSSTQWHNVKAFNKAAGIVRDLLNVGDRVHVEGEMVYSKTEKDGRTFQNADVIMQRLDVFKAKDPNPR